MTAATVLAATTDAFLGGRVAAIQPIGGYHRSGLDAVLLAAAIEGGFTGTVVDLGAGTGVAGLAVAARCADTSVVLIERDHTLAECATASLALAQNRSFAERVTVIATDIRDAAKSKGLAPETADAVIMNPPFHEPEGGTQPQSLQRRAAYVLEDGLEPWVRAAVSLVAAHGSFAMIFRADRLDDVLAATHGRFGDVRILPIAPRAGDAATRVIVAGRKGSRGPLRLLPPLILHGPTGNGYLPHIEAVLRDGVALSAVHPPWIGLG